MISSTARVYLHSALELMQQLKAAGMEVFRPPAFEPGSFNDATLSNVKRSGWRIVLMLASVDDVKVVASKAAIQIMSTGWAWMLPEERDYVPAMQVTCLGVFAFSVPSS